MGWAGSASRVKLRWHGVASYHDHPETSEGSDAAKMPVSIRKEVCSSSLMAVESQVAFCCPLCTFHASTAAKATATATLTL